MGRKKLNNASERGSLVSWNTFQSLHKGLHLTQADISARWRDYKDGHYTVPDENPGLHNAKPVAAPSRRTRRAASAGDHVTTPDQDFGAPAPTSCADSYPQRYAPQPREHTPDPVSHSPPRRGRRRGRRSSTSAPTTQKLSPSVHPLPAVKPIASPAACPNTTRLLGSGPHPAGPASPPAPSYLTLDTTSGGTGNGGAADGDGQQGRPDSPADLWDCDAVGRCLVAALAEGAWGRIDHTPQRAPSAAAAAAAVAAGDICSTANQGAAVDGAAAVEVAHETASAPTPAPAAEDVAAVKVEAAVILDSRAAPGPAVSLTGTEAPAAAGRAAGDDHPPEEDNPRSPRQGDKAPDAELGSDGAEGAAAEGCPALPDVSSGPGGGSDSPLLTGAPEGSPRLPRPLSPWAGNAVSCTTASRSRTVSGGCRTVWEAVGTTPGPLPRVDASGGEVGAKRNRLCPDAEEEEEEEVWATPVGGEWDSGSEGSEVEEEEEKEEEGGCSSHKGCSPADPGGADDGGPSPACAERGDAASSGPKAAQAADAETGADITLKASRGVLDATVDSPQAARGAAGTRGLRGSSPPTCAAYLPARSTPASPLSSFVAAPAESGDGGRRGRGLHAAAVPAGAAQQSSGGCKGMGGGGGGRSVWRRRAQGSGATIVSISLVSDDEDGDRDSGAPSATAAAELRPLVHAVSGGQPRSGHDAAGATVSTTSTSFHAAPRPTPGAPRRAPRQTNLWNVYQREVAGTGLTRAQMKEGFARWKDERGRMEARLERQRGGEQQQHPQHGQQQDTRQQRRGGAGLEEEHCGAVGGDGRTPKEGKRPGAVEAHRHGHRSPRDAAAGEEAASSPVSSASGSQLRLLKAAPQSPAAPLPPAAPPPGHPTTPRRQSTLHVYFAGTSSAHPPTTRSVCGQLRHISTSSHTEEDNDKTGSGSNGCRTRGLASRRASMMEPSSELPSPPASPAAPIITASVTATPETTGADPPPAAAAVASPLLPRAATHTEPATATGVLNSIRASGVVVPVAGAAGSPPEGGDPRVIVRLLSPAASTQHVATAGQVVAAAADTTTSSSTAVTAAGGNAADLLTAAASPIVAVVAMKDGGEDVIISGFQRRSESSAGAGANVTVVEPEEKQEEEGEDVNNATSRGVTGCVGGASQSGRTSQTQPPAMPASSSPQPWTSHFASQPPTTSGVSPQSPRPPRPWLPPSSPSSSSARSSQPSQRSAPTQQPAAAPPLPDSLLRLPPTNSTAPPRTSSSSRCVEAPAAGATQAWAPTTHPPEQRRHQQPQRGVRRRQPVVSQEEAAARDNRRLREDVDDDDPLLAGFTPWTRVCPDPDVLAAARPPPRPGIYEWGALPPGGSRVLAFYLGKAGGGGSKESLRSRFNKYAASTRLMVGPAAALWAAERAARETLLGSERGRGAGRPRVPSWSAEAAAEAGKAYGRSRSVAESRKAEMWRQLQARGFELYYRYRLCILSTRRGSSGGSGSGGSLGAVKAEVERKAAGVAEDAVAAERALHDRLNYAACLVHNGSYRQLLLRDSPRPRLEDYPVVRPELADPLEAWAARADTPAPTGPAGATRGQQARRAAAAAAASAAVASAATARTEGWVRAGRRPPAQFAVD